jgi:VWFA-related protein
MRGQPAAGACVAAVLALGAAALAQQQPTFKAKVQLVRVDATVVDAEGNPVQGLTQADFELFDRGRPQPIATFTAVHHDPPPAIPAPAPSRDVASNVVDDSSELMVLVLDDLHIRKEWTAKAKDVVTDFVYDLGPDVLVALLSTSGKYRVELTTDHARILAAIASFSGAETKLAFNNPGSSNGGPKTSVFTAEEIKLRHLNPDGPPVSTMTSSTGSCVGTLYGPPADSKGLFNLFESAAHVLSTEDRRHKALAWVSTGASFGAEGARQAIDAMKAGGVVLYAIDPIGTHPVMADGSYGTTVCPDSHTFEQVKTPWQIVADNKISSLTNTSRATGGEAIVNTDDLAGGVRKIVQDFGEYYVLGFYPDDVSTPGLRTLEVKTTRAGLAVRARLNYSIADDGAPSTAAALASLAGDLAPTGDLPLRLYAAALPSPTSSRARVVVTIEVTAPTADLTTPDGLVTDRLRYGLYAVDLQSGKAVRSAARDATFELGHQAMPLPPSVTYAVDASLALTPGRYQVRASAMSERTGLKGSVFLPLDVPDFHGSPLVLGDLVLGESAVPVAAGADFNVLQAAHALPFAPTLDRVFTRARRLRIFSDVSTTGNKPVTATVAMLTPTGATVWSDAHPLPRSGQLDLTLPLERFSASPYTLRVTATDGEHTAAREVGIVVR